MIVDAQRIWRGEDPVRTSDSYQGFFFCPEKENEAYTNIMSVRRTVQWLVAASASVTQISASPHGLVPRQGFVSLESCPGYKASNVQQTDQGLTVSTNCFAQKAYI